MNFLSHIIICHSGVESRFAESLDNDPDVKMFFKIPSRFKIETPIGSYNPDWAVFLEKNGEQKLYFVIESKGTTALFDLRTPEQLKIHCGKQHFDTLDVNFPPEPVKDWKEFKYNKTCCKCTPQLIICYTSNDYFGIELVYIYTKRSVNWQRY